MFGIYRIGFPHSLQHLFVQATDEENEKMKSKLSASHSTASLTLMLRDNCLIGDLKLNLESLQYCRK